MVIEPVSGLPNSPLFNLMDSSIILPQKEVVIQDIKKIQRDGHCLGVKFMCRHGILSSWLCSNLMYCIARDPSYFERCVCAWSGR